MNIVAELRWLPQAQGGRVSPPAKGTLYSTLARFLDEPENRQDKEAWSLILELQEPPDASGVTKANVRFLSEAVPIDWLKPGAHFALYEGTRNVAEGIVLDQTHPSSLTNS